MPKSRQEKNVSYDERIASVIHRFLTKEIQESKITRICNA